VNLEELFKGGGEPWASLLIPTLEAHPDVATFLAPGRDKNIVPVRELTFQALKPNPPDRWKVIIFGQNPYPRVESATGIAMFDNAFKEWSDGRFGSVTSIRCIIKAACMSKHGVEKGTSVAALRTLLAKNDVVPPPEWFQAMLTQGVLLLNAALTASSDGALSTAQHTAFWKPVIEKTVEEILRAKHASADPARKGVVFAWWGSHAKALRKRVEKLVAAFPSVRVAHVDHCNPAAMGDAFCEGDPFGAINAALDEKVDWLPVRGWREAHGEHAQRMGDFVQETMELHQLYLERLQEVREEKLEELAAIEGISGLPAMAFSDAATLLGTVLPGLLPAVRMAEEFGRKASGLFSKLSAHEIAALHLYTLQSALYRQLNASLRHPDRAHARPYFAYLRLFLSALQKLEPLKGSLWRGVALDLKAQYPLGRTVTWWGVSSCTPNLQVARNFLGSEGRRTLFEVSVHRAVSIKKYSAFHGEDEYVLAPGTRLRVAEVQPEPDGLTRVRLEELPEAHQVG
jgi:uracil DNA glycosylase